MPIVDAQVHIWANHRPANPNHRQVDTFSKDDLLEEMDAAGVPWLSGRDQELVMGRAICDWLDWKLPERAR